jgi:CTP synthase (UTP-ammonia lyase)
VIELPEHSFFLGTLFLPQLRSLPGRPHPLISAFVRAAIKRGRAL